MSRGLASSSSNNNNKKKKQQQEKEPSSSSSDDDASSSDDDDSTTTTSSSSDDDSSSSNNSDTTTDSSSDSASSPKQNNKSTSSKQVKKAKTDNNNKTNKSGGGGGQSVVTLNTSDLTDLIKKFEPQFVTNPPLAAASNQSQNNNNNNNNHNQRNVVDVPLLDGYRQAHKNNNLVFPKGTSWNVFDLIVKKLPRGKHRCIDLFLFASEMFYVSLAIAMNEQKKKKTAEQLRAGGFKFKWMNSGPVAENFAIVCDQAKLLHSQLRHEIIAKVHNNNAVNGNKDCPPLNIFMNHMLHYIQAGSQQREEELPVKTYEIKLKDWEKGGTRYDTSSADTTMKSNIVFAAADVRMNKLQGYIDHRVKRSEEMMKNNNNNNNDSSSSSSDEDDDNNNNNNNNMMMMMGNNNNKKNKNNTNEDDAGGSKKKNAINVDDDDDVNNNDDDANSLLSYFPASLLQASATRVVSSSSNNNNQPQHVAANKQLNITGGSASTSIQQQQTQQQQQSSSATTSGPVSLFSSFYQSNSKYPTDAPIRIKIFQIIGGPQALSFPVHGRDRLPEYIAHAQSVADPHFRIQILNWIAKSTRPVHQSYERLGGLILARRWVDELLVVENDDEQQDQEDAAASSNFKNKVHEETLKLPKETKENLLLQMCEKIKQFCFVATSGTKNAWELVEVENDNNNSNNQDDDDGSNNNNKSGSSKLLWLRQKLELPDQQDNQKNSNISPHKQRLLQGVEDLETALTQTPRNLSSLLGNNNIQQNNNNNQTTVTLGIRRSATNQIGQQNIPANLANFYHQNPHRTTITIFGSSGGNNNNNQNNQSNNNNNRMRVESYHENKNKLAFEEYLRYSNNNNNKKGGFQQQQQQQPSSTSSSALLNKSGSINMNANTTTPAPPKFDEIFRPMPLPPNTAAAINNNNSTPSTSGGGGGNNGIFALLATDAAIKPEQVVDVKSESFDPFKLLGMI